MEQLGRAIDYQQRHNVLPSSTTAKQGAVQHSQGAGYSMLQAGAGEAAMQTAIKYGPATVVAFATGVGEAGLAGAAVLWVGTQVWGYTAGQAVDYVWGKIRKEDIKSLDASLTFTQSEFDSLGDQLDKAHAEKLQNRLAFIDEQIKRVDDFLTKLAQTGGKPHRCGQAYDLYRGVVYLQNQHALAYKELSYLSIYIETKLEWLKSQVTKLNEAKKQAAVGLASRSYDDWYFPHKSCDPRKCVKAF